MNYLCKQDVVETCRCSSWLGTLTRLDATVWKCSKTREESVVHNELRVNPKKTRGIDADYNVRPKLDPVRVILSTVGFYPDKRQSIMPKNYKEGKMLSFSYMPSKMRYVIAKAGFS